MKHNLKWNTNMKYKCKYETQMKHKPIPEGKKIQATSEINVSIKMPFCNILSNNSNNSLLMAYELFGYV